MAVDIGAFKRRERHYFNRDSAPADIAGNLPASYEKLDQIIDRLDAER